MHEADGGPGISGGPPGSGGGRGPGLRWPGSTSGPPGHGFWDSAFPSWSSVSSSAQRGRTVVCTAQSHPAISEALWHSVPPGTVSAQPASTIMKSREDTDPSQMSWPRIVGTPKDRRKLPCPFLVFYKSILLKHLSQRHPESSPYTLPGPPHACIGCHHLPRSFHGSWLMSF